MKGYSDFLESKAAVVLASGKEVKDEDINPKLYDFQRAIVRWACRGGRRSVWADCGLGKTFIQLEWARLMGGRCLILAPLSVARQTVKEAKKIGLDIPYCRSASDLSDTISITNYERLDAFDDERFDSVVIDESSILKSFDGKTRTKIIERFQDVPYRLACTATPAPNDFLELGNHAQFLGIMTWQEMAATFFIHDCQSKNGHMGQMSGAWRLKGHAEKDFWRWLVSWGVFIKKPSDIGFDDRRFILPKLDIRENSAEVAVAPPGMLFHTKLSGIKERGKIRKSTMAERLKIVQRIIGDIPKKDQIILWCGLNDESNELTKMLKGHDARNVQGSDDPEQKAQDLMDFAEGKYRILITKAKIAGFGMNFQNCHRQIFVGMGDSYEAYYQCIRRSWRFGQKKEVTVDIVVSDMEDEIVRNVQRKEEDADKMSREMVACMSDLETKEMNGNIENQEIYMRETAEDPEGVWKVSLGDCVEVMGEMEPDSIDFSVYSPPFASLYTYTASTRDMGNCKNEDQFFDHFNFFCRNLLKITKPGRITACHVAQLAAMASRDGFIGIKDFRGRCIQTFVDNGWIHHGEVVIDKNPQAQAIRTKNKSLLFAQLRKDSSWLRPALSDFILVFRKPGENAVPVQNPDISNEDWIKWAHPVWTDIRETHVLQAKEGRAEKDEKHICPLQLDVIDRCIMLWSNRGEVVFSPFTGIGSEGYQAIMRGRRFVGAELKQSYFQTAQKNMKRAMVKSREGMLI